jgi:hypothetical protein
LDVHPVEVAIISQQLASAGSEDEDASIVSRWDRDASSWIGLAEALLSRPGTRFRTSLLATELGVDDLAWLRAQQASAQRLSVAAADADLDLYHRAQRMLITITDVLESYRTPLFCGEVAVISERQPLTEVFLREIGANITVAFDVLHRGETTTVAARQRWVGGYDVERNVAGMAESLRLGLPARGGLGPRRLVDVLSLTEGACAFQWPIPAGASLPTVPSTAARSLPAPAGVATGGSFIGHDLTGRDVRLSREDRASHVHVIGVTGSGKSTFQDRICASDVMSGGPLVLIDRHGPLTRRVRRRLLSAGRQFVLIDPGDQETSRIALFPRRPDGTIDAERLMRQISRLIEAITAHLPGDWSGPRFRDAARMALTVVAYAGADLQSVIRLLVERKHVAALCARAERAGTPVPTHVVAWMDAHHEPTNTDRASVAQWVASKFDELANSSTLPKVIDTTGDGIDLAAAIAQGIPILADLGSTDEIEARLLGSLLLGMTLDAALERPPHERTFLPIGVDEAQKFYVSNLERALNEGRKFGVSLTLAHQHLSQFEPRVRDAIVGGCALTVAFRLNDSDASALAPRFGVRPRDLSGLQNLDAVLHRADLGGAQPAFNCRLPPYEDLDRPTPEPAADADRSPVRIPADEPEVPCDSLATSATVPPGTYTRQGSR